MREPVKWRAVSPQGTSSSGSEPRCSRRTAATHRPRPDRAATCGASGRLPGRPPLDRRGAAASGNTGAILISFIDGADGGRPRKEEAAAGPVWELPARVTGPAMRRSRFTHGRRVRTPSV